MKDDRVQVLQALIGGWFVGALMGASVAFILARFLLTRAICGD